MPSHIITLYYNPRCSKCREALALLEENGREPEIIEYLKTPPTREELKAILRKLGMRPADIVRKGEEIYKTQYKDRELSDDEWLDALVAHPVLIERPIVVRGDRAMVARPPEKVLELM